MENVQSSEITSTTEQPANLEYIGADEEEGAEALRRRFSPREMEHNIIRLIETGETWWDRNPAKETKKKKREPTSYELVQVGPPTYWKWVVHE